MTHMDPHPLAGRPLDMSEEYFYLPQHDGSNEFRKTFKRRHKATMAQTAKNIAVKYPFWVIAGSAALGVLAPHLVQHHTLSHPQESAKPHGKPKAKIKAALAKPVVKVSYKNIAVSAQPTAKDTVEFLNSIDRIMSNKEWMQDIFDISAINGSDPLDIMLTSAFENSGDVTKFNHTVYHQNGKTVRHSARGPFQDMPDQFVALARQDGVSTANKLRLYARTLSDHNRQIFMLQKADELEKLSRYLQQSPYKKYKDLVAHDPIAKAMLNQRADCFSSDWFIDMVLQDASNVKGANDLNTHVESQFHLTRDQALALIGQHIELHIENYLGPHMAQKMVDLLAAGKGDLPMYPNVFPKLYMAMQNFAYCKQWETKTTHTVVQVRVHVPQMRTTHILPHKPANAAHHLVVPVQGAHHRQTPAHNGHRPLTPAKRTRTAKKHAPLIRGHQHKAVPQRVHLTPATSSHKQRPQARRGDVHARRTVAEARHASRILLSRDKHVHKAPKPQLHTPRTPLHGKQGHNPHARTATARGAHLAAAQHQARTTAPHGKHPAAKPAITPQFRTVTLTHQERTCASLMTIRNVWDGQVKKYEKMYPSEQQKFDTDARLSAALANQYKEMQEHRALFLAAMDGSKILPPVSLSVQQAARPVQPKQQAANTTHWYQQAASQATAVYNSWFGKPSHAVQTHSSSSWFSFTAG